MPQIDRFSVSLDTELLSAFDHHIAGKGYANRSEAVRDLIRDMLLSDRLPSGDETVVAVQSIVCDHGVGEAGKRLRERIVRAGPLVLGTAHTPAGGETDVVTITYRGPAEAIQRIANDIQAIRGIAHGCLALVPVCDIESDTDAAS